MLYSEFIAGTGCKENEHNYEVYKNLEIMYMNSDLSKEQIYEYGKKLVDNGKSENEIKFENEIKAEIELTKKELEEAKKGIEFYKVIDCYKDTLVYYQKEVSRLREKIKMLKWCLK